MATKVTAPTARSRPAATNACYVLVREGGLRVVGAVTLVAISLF